MEWTNDDVHEYLEQFLPDDFRGITKANIIECVLNEDIQKSWRPSIGDIIVGPTGNIFIISGKHRLVEEMGGNLYFFGGGMCVRDGGIIMNETYSSTMNKDGLWYFHEGGIIKKRKKSSHCSFDDFRWVPWPHELLGAFHKQASDGDLADVSERLHPECVYYPLSDRAMCSNNNVCENCKRTSS